MSELNIPESWAEAKLEEVFSVNPRNKIENDRLEVSFVPMSSVNQNSATIESEETRKWGDVKKGYTHFTNGDVIFAKITPCMENKKSSLAENLYNGCGAGSTEFHVLRPPKDILGKFALHFVRSGFFLDDASNNMSGTAGQKRVPRTWLNQYIFPIPPRNEQERIVQKVELCFEKIDATEANLNKVESLLEKLAISFLTKNGEWLETSPLEKLTDERVERIGEENPKCRKIGVDNEIGVVDLRVTGKQNFENYKIVKQGDILYNPMRINVGSLALYNDTEDAITSPDYIVFSIRPEFSKWLVFKFLKSSFGAEEISKKLKGTVRERLYYKSLKEIKFPNPQKDTHKQAERIIEAISTNLLSQKQNLLILISKLKESILLKAFEGRLVEQIPSEGTGHELLAKILAEKEKQQNTVSEAKTKKISPAKAVSSKGKKNGKK